MPNLVRDITTVTAPILAAIKVIRDTTAATIRATEATVKVSASIQGGIFALNQVLLLKAEITRVVDAVDALRLAIYEVAMRQAPTGNAPGQFADMARLYIRNLPGTPEVPPTNVVMPKAAEGAEAAGGLAALLGPIGIAAAGVAAGLTAILAASVAFVGALAPSELNAFNQILKNLEATIGQALEPVIQVATTTLSQISTIIGPLMVRLAPLFQELSEIVASTVIPIINMLVEIIEPLMPIFSSLLSIIGTLTQAVVAIAQIFMGFYEVILALNPEVWAIYAAFAILKPIFQSFGVWLSAFSDSLSVVATIMETVFETVGKVIMSFLPSWLNFGQGFANAIHSATTYLVLFVAELAKQLGFLGFVKDLLANLKGESAVAAGPTAIKDLSSISKDMATASFGAAGTMGEDKDAWKQQLIDGVQKVVDGGEDSDKTLKGIKDELKVIADWLKVPKQIETAASAAKPLGIAALAGLSPSLAALFAGL